MRAFEDATKFHSMKRSPTGSPPSSISVARDRASTTAAPAPNTTSWPALSARPSASTSPSMT
jgi:hypothetical protein